MLTVKRYEETKMSDWYTDQEQEFLESKKDCDPMNGKKLRGVNLLNRTSFSAEELDEYMLGFGD